MSMLPVICSANVASPSWVAVVRGEDQAVVAVLAEIRLEIQPGVGSHSAVDLRHRVGQVVARVVDAGLLAADEPEVAVAVASNADLDASHVG